MHLYITMALSLFLLMDPLGNIPIFLSVLKQVEPKRQRWIIFRELIIALAIIIAFYFLGEGLLGILNISQSAVLISGGLILFIIGLQMIFPSPTSDFKWPEGREPFLVPLAIPLVAGPAALAAVMLYARQDIPICICLSAIVTAWLATFAILISSIPLKRILGTRGLAACESLSGLILLMVSVNMFLEGFVPLFKNG
jgi:multiple antibiotic resistance protein